MIERCVMDDVSLSNLGGRYRWASISPPHLATYVRVLSCLSDVPQSRADIADDLVLRAHEVGDAIRALRLRGWRIYGSLLAGYTLEMSTVQREWLATLYGRYLRGVNA